MAKPSWKPRSVKRSRVHAIQIVLDTHSFQAPLFSQRLGFEIITSHTDYPQGHYRHYLRKQLVGLEGDLLEHRCDLTWTKLGRGGGPQ